MESIDLDMDDVFGRDTGVEDDGEFPQPPAMPELDDADLGQDEEGQGGEGENEELSTSVLNKLKNIKGAAKKVVTRPQPKLDPARLTGDRGIPIIPNLFKDVKFKGRGHEREDLKKMMSVLEHWAHRLFPKMPFDEVLERVERLGKKKEVQTCVNKMRLDMPLLDEDFVSADQDNSGDEAEKAGDNIDGDDEELFDEILREEEERRRAEKQAASQQFASEPMTSDLPTPANENSANVTSTPIAKPQQDVVQELTPEQLERIKRNKEIALQKRAARLGFQSPSEGKFQVVTPAKVTSTGQQPSQDSQPPVTPCDKDNDQEIPDRLQITSDLKEVPNNTDSPTDHIQTVTKETDDMATEEELIDMLDDRDDCDTTTGNPTKDMETIQE